MPDVLDRNGLQIKTLSELMSELQASMRNIYGEDISLEQDDPDGQLIGIFAQAGIDMRELIQDLVSSLDPDQAEGVILDQRAAINGVSRKAGTFTLINIDIVIDRPLNLVGLDEDATNINGSGYTAQDDVGNSFILLQSESFSSAGTYTCQFRSKTMGKVLVTPNTVTTPVTVIPGVISLNNPSAALTTGVDEESDKSLRIRRSTMMATGSRGFVDSIEAALKNINEVSEAVVDENTGDVIDPKGTPPHSIWAIVEGGDPQAIGEVIYVKRPSGCGMRGAQSVTVPRPGGRTFTAYFDRPTYVNLYLQFYLGIKGGGIFDADWIKSQIVENISYNLGDSAFADVIVAFILTLNPDYYVTDLAVSINGSDWLGHIPSNSPQNKYLLDVSQIEIINADEEEP